MNKRIILITAILFLGAVFTSCDDYLSKDPTDRPNLNTETNIQKLLVSAYPVSSTYLMCEMASDNADENGGSWTPYDLVQTESFLWTDGTQVEEDSPYRIWSDHYAAIGTACVALEEIEATGSPSSLDGARAEALLCRAYGHFVLANMFCMAYHENTASSNLGIPYMKEAETELVVTYTRGTLEETFRNIADDIEEALPLISKASYDVSKYHFNQSAAYAFAARFYLYYRNYPKAIDYATKALGNNPAEKLRGWASGTDYRGDMDKAGNWFVDQGVKANLLLVPAQSLWGRVHGAYATGSRYTYNSTINDNEVNTLPWMMKYRPYSLQAAAAKVVVYKFAEYFEYVDPVAGIGFTHIVQPLFTADETLLVRAEAYALLDRLDEAFSDLYVFADSFTLLSTTINGIKTKQEVLDRYKGLAYYTPVAPTAKKAFNLDFAITEDQENMLHAILHHRRALTIHEGLRWHDVKRYGMEIYRRYVYNDAILVNDRLTPNDPRRAFQLPQSIIAAGLQANPR